MSEYTERSTGMTRLDRGRRQRYHDKIAPAQTMIIDGKRCTIQRIIGGVWRDEPEICYQSNENYPPTTDARQQGSD